MSVYSWPGNIRELVNVIDFACAIAADPEITIADLPDQVFRRRMDGPPDTEDRLTPAAASEAATLRENLRRAGWNVSATARLLGIDRTTLHRRMRRLGVTPPPRAT